MGTEGKSTPDRDRTLAALEAMFDSPEVMAFRAQVEGALDERLAGLLHRDDEAARYVLGILVLRHVQETVRGHLGAEAYGRAFTTSVADWLLPHDERIVEETADAVAAACRPEIAALAERAARAEAALARLAEAHEEALRRLAAAGG